MSGNSIDQGLAIRDPRIPDAQFSVNESQIEIPDARFKKHKSRKIKFSLGKNLYLLIVQKTNKSLIADFENGSQIPDVQKGTHLYPQGI